MSEDEKGQGQRDIVLNFMAEFISGFERWRILNVEIMAGIGKSENVSASQVSINLSVS